MNQKSVSFLVTVAGFCLLWASHVYAEVATPRVEANAGQAQPSVAAEEESLYSADVEAPPAVVKGAEVKPAAAVKTQAETEKKDPPTAAELASTTRVESTEVLQKLLAEAEALMKVGQSKAAYELLLPAEFELAGDQNFDYLLGIAALDSGKPDKATLAFERVLSVDPNYAGARLDMARAYFQLGDFDRAKTEFAAVLKQEPPQTARDTISKYLEAINKAERAKLIQITGYVEGSLGHDNNVNNSPSQSKVAIPALGNLVFTLNPTNLQSPDNYYTAASGIDINYKLNEMWGVYSGADVRLRGNQTMRTFDFSSLDFRGGATYTRGDDVFRGGAMYSQFSLDHATNRNTLGLTGDWRRTLNAKEQFSLFAQYGNNQFADSAMKVNNFNQFVLGAGLMHMMDDKKTVLFNTLNLATEQAILARADGNKIGFGMRVGAQNTHIEKVDLTASIGFQFGRYSKENAAFLINRNDKLFDVSLGANWHWDKFLSVRPQLSYSSNKSNISIYSFSRIDASINVRRDFR